VKLFDLIKKKLSENLFILVITGTLAGFEIINKFTAFIKDILISQVDRSIIATVIFYLTFSICRHVESEKNNDFDESNFYPKNQIRIAKFLKFTAFFLLLIPIFSLFNYCKESLEIKRNKIVQTESCTQTLKKTAVLIANFTKDFDEDSFSSSLFGKLNSDLQHSDSINLRQLKRYIVENNENYLDTIKNAFQENCAKSGLIIYGNRTSKNENQLNCRIYSLNYLKFVATGFLKTKDSTIIYIQNPQQINFTVDNQANVISEFIHGLLYYHACDYKAANKSMSKALTLNDNPENKQFISMCHLFIANASVFQNKYSVAIESYKKGISIDSTNAYLHYNLATILNKNKDINQAFEEFEIAHNLYKELKNPLQQIISNKPDPDLKMMMEKKYLSDNKISIKRSVIKPMIQIPKEHWYIIAQNQKYGIISSDGDTIARCMFDIIDYRYLKKTHCFVGQAGKKYGAFMLRYDDKNRAYWHVLHTEYSIFTIEDALDNCLNKHLNLNSSKTGDNLIVNE